MTEGSSPTDVVLALMRVINGDAPEQAARAIVDPQVRIHMDSTVYCGIDVWYRWIRLIHDRGRLADLRIAQCEARCSVQDPTLVQLTGRWTGTSRSQRMQVMAGPEVEASYRVLNGMVTEIWTNRSNYDFVFSRWTRLSMACQALLDRPARPRQPDGT
jgi:hypothetical protein